MTYTLQHIEPRLDPPADDPEGPCVCCGRDTTNHDGEVFRCRVRCDNCLTGCGTVRTCEGHMICEACAPECEVCRGCGRPQ